MDAKNKLSKMKNNRKVVLISGASYGIGYYLALEYAKLGYDLFLLARSIGKLEALKAQLANYPFRVEICKCDVKNKVEVKESIDKCIEIYSKIDIAILNAAIGNPNSFTNMEIDIIEDIYQTNLFGVLYFFNELVPIMKKQKISEQNLRGKIVVLSSLADARAFVGSSAYCSAKKALSMMMEAASIELEKEKISVITVKPGFVKSYMTSKNNYAMPLIWETDQAAKYIVKNINKNKRLIIFPKIIYFVVSLIKLIPFPIYKYLSRFRKI